MARVKYHGYCAVYITAEGSQNWEYWFRDTATPTKEGAVRLREKIEKAIPYVFAPVADHVEFLRDRDNDNCVPYVVHRVDSKGAVLKPYALSGVIKIRPTQLLTASEETDDTELPF